jgi:hypothetical protein
MRLKGGAMKLMEHPVEWFVCTVVSAATPWLLPLVILTPVPVPVAQAGGAAPEVIVVNWPAVQFFLVLTALGMIGGAISLVRNPLPIRSFWDGFGRVLLGGAVSSLLAGVVLHYVFGASNPAVITAVGGFVGFISYPLVLWGHKYALGWFLKKLNVPVEETKGDGQ